MTYYTIEFTNEKSTWVHEEFKSIAKYDSIIRAQGIANYLLKSDPILKYNIIKHEQEVVETKEKETSSKSDILHHKTRYIVQYRSDGLPGIWIDLNEGEFTSKDMAQWTINGSKKDSPLRDVNYRIVQRDFYYEDKEV